eukprot:COSAG01_NODE_30717_length_610_cov_4.876712_1_plen_89_part_10
MSCELQLRGTLSTVGRGVTHSAWRAPFRGTVWWCPTVIEGGSPEGDGAWWAGLAHADTVLYFCLFCSAKIQSAELAGIRSARSNPVSSI